MKKYHRLLCLSVFVGVVILVHLGMTIVSHHYDQNANYRRYRKFFYEDEEQTSKLNLQDNQRLLRDAESENNERQQTIEKTCKKYNLGLYRQSVNSKIKHPPVPHYSVFYFDRPHKLSYCPIYKSGSSTWLYNLCFLAGMTEEYITKSKKQLSELARSQYPELDPSTAEETLQNTIKVLTVRHPFERLLSAYRDKLENINYGQEHGTVFFYQAFGSKIVKKYRKNGNETKSWDLLQPSQYLWNENHPKPSGIEPTFSEFVRYLIDLDLVKYSDDHWIPYYLYCTPCLLRYQIVAKVETLFRDQLYAIHVLGLQDLIKPIWQHKTQFVEGVASNDTVSFLSKIYFRQLSTKEINNLHEKYRIDFELFNYDHSPYLQYAFDYEK